MRLFRRRTGSSGNNSLPPDFTAQIEQMLRSCTPDQLGAIQQAIHHSEKRIAQALIDLEGRLNRNLERLMAHTLEETLAAVEAESTSEAAIIALLTGIKKQLDDALAGGLTPSQQMRVDAIFNKATENKTAIDDAVKANTEGGPAGGDKVATITTITSSANPANAGDTFTLSGGVTSQGPANGNAISGTITFFEGSASLGSGSVDSSGVATISSSSLAGGNLATGDHTLHASYSGDANYASSDSADLVETIGTPVISSNAGGPANNGNNPSTGQQPSPGVAASPTVLPTGATVPGTAPGPVGPGVTPVPGAMPVI